MQIKLTETISTTPEAAVALWQANTRFGDKPGYLSMEEFRPLLDSVVGGDQPVMHMISRQPRDPSRSGEAIHVPSHLVPELKL